MAAPWMHALPTVASAKVEFHHMVLDSSCASMMQVGQVMLTLPHAGMPCSICTAANAMHASPMYCHGLPQH